jgi:drug/metabolite transporter (DMT)-like permease
MYQVLTRKLTPSVRPGVLQLSTGALGTTALAPFLLFHWVPPDLPLNWMLLCGLGVFAWAGHEAMTRAYSFATASALAPFGYSFVLYLTLGGFLVFAERPELNTLVGAALIVASGLYAWRKTR